MGRDARRAGRVGVMLLRRESDLEGGHGISGGFLQGEWRHRTCVVWFAWFVWRSVRRWRPPEYSVSTAYLREVVYRCRDGGELTSMLMELSGIPKTVVDGCQDPRPRRQTLLFDPDGHNQTQVHLHLHLQCTHTRAHMLTHHRTLTTDVICIRASDQIIEPFSDCSESTFITDTTRPIAFPTRLDQPISKTPASDLCMDLGRSSGVSVDEVW